MDEDEGERRDCAAVALENAAKEGLEVAPLCPFIAHYIKRHPEFEHLVAGPGGSPRDVFRRRPRGEPLSAR